MTFNPDLFIQDIFPMASMLLETYDGSLDRRIQRNWTCCFVPDPVSNEENDQIISTILHNHNYFSVDQASLLLQYAACTHPKLIPTIVDNMSNKLTAESVILALTTCESRNIEYCWYLMEEYLGQMDGTVLMLCIAICCRNNNHELLKRLIESQYDYVSQYAKLHRDNDLYIDDAIYQACLQNYSRILDVLLEQSRDLAPRLFRAAVLSERIDLAARVVDKAASGLILNSSGEYHSPLIKQAYLFDRQAQILTNLVDPLRTVRRSISNT